MMQGIIQGARDGLAKGSKRLVEEKEYKEGNKEHKKEVVEIKKMHPDY